MEHPLKNGVDARFHAVVLMLTAMAAIVGAWFWFAEGFWTGIASFAFLLIVILLAAAPLRSRS